MLCVLLLIRWSVPEAVNSTSPAGACSNFRLSCDKRHFSRYEFHSFNDRLRFHGDARSSNHYMVVPVSNGLLDIAVQDCEGCYLFGVSPATLISAGWFGAIEAGPVTLSDLNVAVPNLSV